MYIGLAPIIVAENINTPTVGAAVTQCLINILERTTFSVLIVFAFAFKYLFYFSLDFRNNYTILYSREIIPPFLFFFPRSVLDTRD